jgi:hypothetical protein
MFDNPRPVVRVVIGVLKIGIDCAACFEIGQLRQAVCRTGVPNGPLTFQESTILRGFSSCSATASNSIFSPACRIFQQCGYRVVIRNRLIARRA